MQKQPFGFAIVAGFAALAFGLTGCTSHATPNRATAAPVSATNAQAVAPGNQPIMPTQSSSESKLSTPSTSPSPVNERDSVHNYLTNPNRAENLQAKVHTMGLKIAEGMQNGKFGPVADNNLLGQSGWTWFETRDESFGVLVPVDNGVLKFDQVAGIKLQSKGDDPTTRVIFSPPNDPNKVQSDDPLDYWVLTSFADDHMMSTDMTNLLHPEMTVVFSPTTLADMHTLNERVIRRANDNMRSWYPNWKE